MKKELKIFGKIVKKYNFDKYLIDDLNEQYEKAKNKLASFGPRLAGRIKSELEFTSLLQETKIFKPITECMEDYIQDFNNYGVEMYSPIKSSNDFKDNKSISITGCWINDMKSGEYNPPHTHWNLSGWSTVLFLKVPEFLNDSDPSTPHKFRDGKLGFITEIETRYFEPQIGDFFIFSASHQHLVMPFKTKLPNDIRRSMSFNFIYKEDIENNYANK